MSKRHLDDKGLDAIKRQKIEDGSPKSVDKLAAAKARIAALTAKRKQGSASPAPSTAATNSSLSQGDPNDGKSQDEASSEKHRTEPSERTPQNDVPSSNKKDMLARIKARKQALASQQKERSSSEPSPPPQKKTRTTEDSSALNQPLHPLLAKLEHNNNSNSRGDRSTPENKTSIQNNIYLLQPDDDDTTADNESESSNSRRRRRGLQFNQPGKYIHIAENIRKEAEMERLQKEAEERRKNKLIQQGMDLVAGEAAFKPDEPPQLEWWDQEIDLDSINDLIQHPIEISPPWEKHQPKEMTLHMTKKELKRRRKLNRAEIHKEQQDRIRLGLDPAPPPKVKLNNLNNVYANQAVENPTALEAKVKREIQQRKDKHDEENESRKLTGDELWEKKQDKLERDKGKGIHSAIFRIENLSDGKHKYIVNAEARSNNFTGIVIFNPKFALVVVEGGELQVKKYIKRLNRIDWTVSSPVKEEGSPKEDQEQSYEQPQDLSQNRCSLVWKGPIKQNRFNRWTLKDAETEQDAKDLLRQSDVESYWIMARNCVGDQ